MAGKSYDMQFLLNAQMGGGFNAAFSGAQQKIAALQREIQTLNRTQADITAYQKQQSAIEATRGKLEMLKQQYANLAAAQEKAGGADVKLANQMLAKQHQIDKTNASLENQTQKLDQMGAALKKAGVDTGNLTQESARLSAEVENLKQKQDEAAKSATSFGERASEAINTVAEVLAAAGIVAAVSEIGKAFMDCVSTAADFEGAMSTVEALSGASAADMAQLSAAAKELGATTQFTAQESADAMSYMAMAGWDAQQMISGMPAVLSLAAASGEELAAVSDIVTDSLTAFHMSAGDAAHFSDVLATAATNANTNVGLMGETFKYVAPIAGALGYTVEDMAAAVGLMANAGIKGSMSGTALRNVIDGLAGSVTLTGAAFGEFEFSAVNADGSMKTFGETISELRGYFEQMTAAEQRANAEAIAGQRGYAGLLAIVTASDKDFQTLTESINDCAGAAERMAKIRMDNLNGQITKLNSAWEALKITIGEQFTPVLQSAAAVGTDVLTQANAFLSKNPEVIQGVTAFVGVAGTAAAAITAVSAAVKVLKALNVAAVFTGPVGAAIGLGAALTGVAVAYASAHSISKELTVSSRFEQERLEALNAEYRRYVDTGEETSAEALRLKAQIDELGATFEENRQTIGQLIAENQRLVDSHNEIMSSYGASTTAIHDEYLQTLSLAQALEDMAAGADKGAGAQERLGTVAGALREKLPGVTEGVEITAENALEMADAFRAAAEEAQKAAEFQANLETWGKLTGEHAGLVKGAAEAQENYNEKLQDFLGTGDRANSVLAGATSGNILAAAAAAMQAFGLAELARSAETASDSLAENEAQTAACKEAIDGYVESVAEAADNAAGTAEAIDTVTAHVTALCEAYNEAYTAAYSSLSGQFSLWDEAGAVSSTSMETLQKNLESQITYWQNYNTNLDAVALAAETAGVDLSGIWERLSAGSPEAAAAVQGIADAISSSADGGKEALSAYAESYAELQTALGQTSDTIAENSDKVKQAFQGVEDAIKAGAESADMTEEFMSAAENTIQGYINGLGDGSEVSTILAEQATEWLAAFDAALGVASPSTITYDSGVYTIQGYVNGAEAEAPAAVAAVQAAANKVIAAFQAVMNKNALYSAGQAAIQGAINGINSMLPALEEAAANAGRAAAEAYREAQDIHSPSRLFAWFSQMDIAGAIQGVQDNQAAADQAFAASAISSANAYQRALTRESAYVDASGYAVMLSPELMSAVQSRYMSPAAATASFASGGGGRPIQITIQVDGSPSPETIGRLEEFVYSEAFEARIQDVLSENQTNAARSAYR